MKNYIVKLEVIDEFGNVIGTNTVSSEIIHNFRIDHAISALDMTLLNILNTLNKLEEKGDEVDNTPVETYILTKEMFTKNERPPIPPLPPDRRLKEGEQPIKPDWMK